MLKSPLTYKAEISENGTRCHTPQTDKTNTRLSQEKHITKIFRKTIDMFIVKLSSKVLNSQVVDV